MKNLIILVFFFVVSVTVFAGDLYINCGIGTVETMEEFTSSDLLENGEGYSTFINGTESYTIFYSKNVYTFYKSNINTGEFETGQLSAKGPFRESELFNGHSCHIND